ncbi:MAG: flippase-like domain-containing protein [Phycisphaeraceae bacterium]
MNVVTSQPRPRLFWRLLQAAVSVAMLTWLFTRPGFIDHLGEVIFTADPGWIAGGLLLAGMVQLLNLWRWYIFLRMVGVHIPTREATGIFFTGLFFNLFLPGAAGGDLVRIAMLKRRGYDIGRSALSVVMDHAAGSVSMILVATTAMAMRHDWLMRDENIAAIAGGIYIYLGAVTFLIILSLIFCAAGVPKRLPSWWPGRASVIELSHAYFECARQWRTTLVAIVVSTVMLVLFFLMFFMAARAYGVNAPVVDFFAMMPTIDIISGLPISLGGLGVRENIFAYLMGRLLDVPEATAAAVSLCGFTMFALWGLPGAILLMVRTGGAPLADAENHERQQAVERAAQRYKGRIILIRYARGKMRWDPAYPAVAARLSRSTRPLLDIGCGMGVLTAYLREVGATQPIVGIELNPRKVKLAQERVAAFYKDATFQQGDAQALPAFQGDVVLLDVLHYLSIDGQKALLEAVADRLPPGGTAMIRTSFRDGSLRYYVTLIEEYAIRLIGWIRGGGCHFPTREEVVAPFEKRGWEVKVEPMWGRTPFNSYLIEVTRPAE